MVVPVLWKDPWKSLNERKMKLLLNVIISHLPTESRNNLSQRVDFLTSSYDKPFFDYISFCKHLNLSEIEKMLEKFQIPDIKEEIFDLFINGDAKFTHLYIPCDFDFLIPGSKHCFSEIEFISCNTSIKDNVFRNPPKVI
jgi:hypothetical protein